MTDKIIHADKTRGLGVPKGRRWSECGLQEEKNPNIVILDSKTYYVQSEHIIYWDSVTCKRCKR